jgi:hypothetical protein
MTLILEKTGIFDLVKLGLPATLKFGISITMEMVVSTLFTG